MRNFKTAIIAKWFTGAALAAALVVATPHKAEAQVGFGIQVGSYPAYGYQQGYGNPYAGREWQRQQYIEHEQHEQFEAERAAQWRHEQWEQQRYYSHDRDGWRGHDDGYRHDGDRY